jgi:hypothetical protein
LGFNHPRGGAVFTGLDSWPGEKLRGAIKSRHFY